MATYPPKNGFANEHLHSHILAATHITASSKAIQEETKLMFHSLSRQSTPSQTKKGLRRQHQTSLLGLIKLEPLGGKLLSFSNLLGSHVFGNAVSVLRCALGTLCSRDIVPGIRCRHVRGNSSAKVIPHTQVVLRSCKSLFSSSD
jgi:hypothetical protein